MSERRQVGGYRFFNTVEKHSLFSAGRLFLSNHKTNTKKQMGSGLQSLLSLLSVPRWAFKFSRICCYSINTCLKPVREEYL